MSANGERPESVDLYEYTRLGPVGNDGDWSVIKFQQDSTNDLLSIRLVSWNVWFDRLHQELRFKSVLEALKSLPAVDVIALQEVTESFISILRADEDLQSAWVITDCWDKGHERGLQSDIWYRNMFLVRKDWSRCMTASVKRLPSSMLRFMVTLEIMSSIGTVFTPSLIRLRLDPDWQCPLRFTGQGSSTAAGTGRNSNSHSPGRNPR
jgi:hypothetical protein